MKGQQFVYRLTLLLAFKEDYSIIIMGWIILQQCWLWIMCCQSRKKMPLAKNIRRLVEKWKRQIQETVSIVTRVWFNPPLWQMHVVWSGKNISQFFAADPSHPNPFHLAAAWRALKCCHRSTFHLPDPTYFHFNSTPTHIWYDGRVIWRRYDTHVKMAWGQFEEDMRMIWE